MGSSQRTAAVSAASALLIGVTMALLLVGHDSSISSPLELAYKWKGYTEPSNVFDDFDQGYKVGKWRDYKKPSNVFDTLPDLANADHPVTSAAVSHAETHAHTKSHTHTNTSSVQPPDVRLIQITFFYVCVCGCVDVCMACDRCARHC